MSAGVSLHHHHYHQHPHHHPNHTTSSLPADRPGAHLSQVPSSMPYLAQPYALPIHRATNSHRDAINSLDISGLHAASTENALRRKTPNGTINAGFHVSLDETNQPRKHLLLNEKHTFSQHEQRRNTMFPGWQPWQSSPLAGPPQHSFPAKEFVLHHTTHFAPQPHYGRTVPSVMQPSLQYVGPTALGRQGAGPYGPYWHDGTFVPYRAAAIRDPRFYHHLPNDAFSRPLTFQADPWQQPSPHPPSWTPAQPLVSYGLSAAAFPSGHSPHPLGDPYNTVIAGPHGMHGRDVSSLGYVSQSAQTSTPGKMFTTPSIDAEFGPSSPNGRQRDHTFAWALQQYRDLLTFIHHTRQQQQHGRAFYGQPSAPPRPSFYPKPPRPSGSGAGSSIRLPHKKTDVESGRPKDEANASPALSRPESVLSLRGQVDDAETPKPRAVSVWSPGALHFHDNEYLRRASYDQYRGASHRLDESVSLRAIPGRTLRRSSGSIASSIQSPLPQDDSPPSRAAVALSSITKLCEEASDEWIDGMHLAGCLAYGLGYYPRALRWFTKVLEREPKHLEATSNMAATMLALGRRQEAEQNWMKVVKAAPNHFEAVEHLVGLLCNHQRSKDAIRVIEYVERALRRPKTGDPVKACDRHSECSSSTASRSPCTSDAAEKIWYDFDIDSDSFVIDWKESSVASEPGFGSSGFAIPGCENGRMLALIHAKGNMLYGLGDNGGAARAFEGAVLIAAGRHFHGIPGLVKHILTVVSSTVHHRSPVNEPILLTPDQALSTAKLCFPYNGELPGLGFVAGGPQSLARKAVISTTSNALLSLAKIFQDGMSNAQRSVGVAPLAHGVRDILALYYLSLSLQPSPSTANNVGILLASVQQAAPLVSTHQRMDIPGVAPGSGIALALQYYNYGLQLDQHHAHLYTNLGSLLKDIGQLDAAINMYERAVKCDDKFDIALANLANAVKDKGRIGDAIVYYDRAVQVSPDFAEAVCGLANALNSVCGWHGRGGIADDGGRRDRWHVDTNGMLVDAKLPGAARAGWIKRVVEIVDKQLTEGESWGKGSLSSGQMDDIIRQITVCDATNPDNEKRVDSLRKTLSAWSGKAWEGARVTRLLERATRRISWQWYCDLYVDEIERPLASYRRPQIPTSLTVPTAPTVLPFHTFTCPMSAQQIRLISQRNGLRISVSTLRAPWLPQHVHRPPQPPAPYLRVGYVSSDFNNHPLAHLMQSVFGLHDLDRVKAYCYATTASDNSIHRQQIQAEAPVFHDASTWSAERLVNQIVQDGIHILINLNGYTRGARNEVFAARPAPIQMSFMGFAGTLGAEWCDYLLADDTAVPPDTLRPWRRNVDLEDQLVDENSGGDNEDWVYGENIIYCRDTFFCCDHKQSAPDASEKDVSWDEEQRKRWQMRKELFPKISDDTVIFGNFNQLYKIDPTTFRTWLRILARVPNSILWLLRFPDLGESHLLATARLWAGEAVASRIIFTDVAPKHLHISRARLCDLVVDTAECNAHTTAADVLWTGTPILTLPRYPYKMCSRMAASILKGALPKTPAGARAAVELIATSEDDYEEKAVALGKSLVYARTSGDHRADHGSNGITASGRLMELRHLLFRARWTSALFDTQRWVRDLEDAYDEAWRRWINGRGGDIWLDRIPRGRTTPLWVGKKNREKRDVRA